MGVDLVLRFSAKVLDLRIRQTLQMTPHITYCSHWWIGSKTEMRLMSLSVQKVMVQRGHIVDTLTKAIGTVLLGFVSRNFATRLICYHPVFRVTIK